jgi:hypothetical protein
MSDIDGEDQGETTRQRKKVDDEIDITPMIDCVFLLLIFFMVTSTMKGTRTWTCRWRITGRGFRRVMRRS